MSTQDDPANLGPFSKAEMSMLIVAISIGIVLVTYSVALIIGMMNPETDIVIGGTIDLSKFETTVFTIVGAGLVVLGITTGTKIASSMKK